MEYLALVFLLFYIFLEIYFLFSNNFGLDISPKVELIQKSHFGARTAFNCSFKNNTRLWIKVFLPSGELNKIDDLHYTWEVSYTSIGFPRIDAKSRIPENTMLELNYFILNPGAKINFRIVSTRRLKGVFNFQFAFIYKTNADQFKSYFSQPTVRDCTFEF